MAYLEPRAVEADDATQTVYIEWSDDHTSRHGITHLRWLCPCAECRGEWGAPGVLDHTETLTPEQTELTDVRQVGRYALMPIWGDGHNSGIYTYEYLRKNCECEECVARRAAGAPPAE